MSSTKENTGHSSKKVPCYCSRCNGKYVDIRTKHDHMALVNIVDANISKEQSSSKCKHKEEHFPNSQNMIIQKVKIQKIKIQKVKIQKVKIAMMKIQIVIV